MDNTYVYVELIVFFGGGIAFMLWMSRPRRDQGQEGRAHDHEESTATEDVDPPEK